VGVLFFTGASCSWETFIATFIADPHTPLYLINSITHIRVAKKKKKKKQDMVLINVTPRLISAKMLCIAFFSCPIFTEARLGHYAG
jgi:hypothetical protein